jgi:hypothetical protein
LRCQHSEKYLGSKKFQNSLKKVFDKIMPQNLNDGDANRDKKSSPLTFYFEESNFGHEEKTHGSKNVEIFSAVFSNRNYILTFYINADERSCF